MYKVHVQHPSAPDTTRQKQTNKQTNEQTNKPPPPPSPPPPPNTTTTTSRMSATDVMYTEMNAGCRMSATDVIQPVLPHDYAMLAVNTVRDAWGHCSLKECSRCRSRWLTSLVKFVSILLEFLAKYSNTLLRQERCN